MSNKYEFFKKHRAFIFKIQYQISDMNEQKVDKTGIKD